MSVLRMGIAVCVLLHARLLCDGRQVPGVKRDNVGAKDWDKAIQLFRKTVIEKFLQVSKYHHPKSSLHQWIGRFPFFK